MRFLGYIVFHQVIQIENEQIKAIHNWLELQSARNIYVFLKFANIYWQFIQGFSRLVILLTSMLKTILIASPAALAELEYEEKDGKGIQVEDRDKKKPAQKSCKGQLKGQKKPNLKSRSKQKKQSP